MTLATSRPTLYDYETFSKELAAEWSQRDEISILAAIAKDVAMPPADRIRAVKLLRQIELDVLRVTGRIAEMVAHRRVTHDGSPASDEITSTIQLLRQAASNVHVTLEAPGAPPHVETQGETIDVESSGDISGDNDDTGDDAPAA